MTITSITVQAEMESVDQAVSLPAMELFKGAAGYVLAVQIGTNLFKIQAADILTALQEHVPSTAKAK